MFHVLKHRFIIGLSIALGLAASRAAAEPPAALTAGEAGAIRFVTPGALDAAAGARLVDGEAVTLSGELRFPDGAGPFPAAVLAHGCNGVDQSMHDWAAALRAKGYATLVLDSFGGRSITEVCSNPLRLSGTQRIPDAYGALRILATHPKVDAKRVALIGYSHGAILGLGAASEWAAKKYAPAGKPAFRAFILFYPYCNIRYPEEERIAAPLRFHLGESDDWTPAAPCLQLSEKLRASGQDASATLYKDAYHGFDMPGLPYYRLSEVGNVADCKLRMESLLGPFPSPAEFAACYRTGATVAGNPAAAALARENVVRQLGELLKP